MNVAVVLDDTGWAAGRGSVVERELYDALCDTYRESGHVFHLLTRGPVAPVPEGMTASTYQRGGLERFLERAEPWFPSARRQLASSGRVAQVMRERKIDVVWFVGPNAFPTDRPYLCFVGDLQHRAQPWFPEVSADGEWLQREVHLRRTIGAASVVVTGTETARAEIERGYGVPAANFRILPLPTPRFALEAPRGMGADVAQRYGLPERYLLYPARYWPHKNHVGLLRALAVLRDRHHVLLPLVLVGSEENPGPLLLGLIRELRLEEQVRVLGYVPREDLVGLYRGALALAYPSFFGPENLPPLEAFALGCPVVAADVPGAREQLGNAALLADPRDENRMAQELFSISNDAALRRALVERGLIRAARWTGRDYVRGIYAALDELAAYVRCWGAAAVAS